MPPCKNDPKSFFRGDEPSPKGHGYCAHAERVGTRMRGRNGSMFVVAKRENGSHFWRVDNRSSEGASRAIPAASSSATAAKAKPKTLVHEVKAPSGETKAVRKPEAKKEVKKVETKKDKEAHKKKMEMIKSLMPVKRPAVSNASLLSQSSVLYKLAKEVAPQLQTLGIRFVIAPLRPMPDEMGRFGGTYLIDDAFYRLEEKYPDYFQHPYTLVVIHMDSTGKTIDDKEMRIHHNLPGKLKAQTHEILKKAFGARLDWDGTSRHTMGLKIR